MSLPSLGAWIETIAIGSQALRQSRRSLHWERGLKLFVLAGGMSAARSLPSLGAWIETWLSLHDGELVQVAPFIGSVD